MSTRLKEDNYKDAYIYLAENYYNKPKEVFKYLADLIAPKLEKGHQHSVLDIGCAKGEFLYYLKSKIDFKRKVGLDFSQKLIDEAKKFEGLKDVDFIYDFAESFNLGERFDCITMTGVLSFFDDIRKPLDNIKKHLKKNAFALITGIFNVYNIDVLIRYRNNKYNNTFESGWNTHSIDTIKKYLCKIGMEVSGIHKFELSFELDERENKSRSWTLNTAEGKRFVNGLGLIYDMLTLEIKFINFNE